MKKIFLYFLIILFYQSASGQINSNIIYYSRVNMPASLANDYYGMFDTRLLAEDLAGLLNKATGKNFTTAIYQPGITAGIFLLLDNNKASAGNETGKLESNGKNSIRITARYTTGISYAMYSWLEELGFHFYLPGDEWSIVPALKSVFNNKTIKKTYHPYFRLRMFSASGGAFAIKGLDENGQNNKDWKQWYIRNRMGCDYIGIGGHIGEAFNISHRKEIENDSLIIAPVNGKRLYSVESKLDPTYKKGVDLFSDWIVSEFKKQQSSRTTFLPFKKYYTVDAGDGLGYCHTPECESRFKTVSDQAFSIVNETAMKIKLADPLAGVSTLAYTERADTPGVKIESNVHVMVVASAYQSVGTAAGLMKAWSLKSKNISLYDYVNIGVWSYDKPFFNLYQYHHYLQFLKSLKIEGIGFETSLSKFGSGIQQYFILKFLCDPYSSVDEVLNEFCKNNFGQAAMPVKKLFKEWYFSDTHLKTNYDYPSFYEDELGRFVQYIIDAENTAGLSTAIKNRIEEIKAYTIYLCKYYELYGELKSLQDYSKNPALRNERTESLLTYTWQLYSTKIFHNTQLNDMLKRSLTADEQEKWNYNKNDHFKKMIADASSPIETAFEKMRKKYLPLATPGYEITDAFLASMSKYSADSIRICTTDEPGFTNFLYPIEFYCAAAGPLKIIYQADSSQVKGNKEKVAIVGVESSDYKFIRNDIITKEKSSGTLIYRLPSKGHYRLYLSQYNATHVCYIIYPGKNLFYHNKKSVLMNGMIMQDNAEKKFYPNKYIAFYTPAADSIYFSNLYYSATNTSHLYSADGAPIPVHTNLQSFYNSAAVPKNSQRNFIFYENSLFRWPPVLKNTAPYYFFLRYPMK